MSELKTLVVERVKLPDRTLGSMYWENEMVAKSLELAWLDNKKGKSCIPNGKYIVTKEQPIPADDPATPVDESGGKKPRPYVHFRLHRVPNRDGILIHPLGDTKDSLGCIGPASRFIDINTDKPKFSYTDSKKKLEYLTTILPDKFWIELKDKE